MNGHNALIALRLKGYMPQWCHVVLWDRRPVYRRFWDHPENAMQIEDQPEIHILPDENVSTLDLRFLRGMQVNMNSFCDAQRTLAALDRIMQFDPQLAVTCVEYPTHASICIYEKGQPFREEILDRRMAE